MIQRITTIEKIEEVIFMSDISEKMRTVRKKRLDYSYELPDLRFRVQTAYRIPLALRRALEKMKNQTKKSMSDLMKEAIMDKCKTEGLQVKLCDNLERLHGKKVYCKLHEKEIKLEECIKCSIPYESNSISE